MCLGPFNVILCFIGIDADSRCNYRSNVDFVHFIWDHFERFPNRKFAITILPSNNIAAQLNLSSALPTSTKLDYLKYYRALSDGLCLDKRNCDQCNVGSMSKASFIYLHFCLFLVLHITCINDIICLFTAAVSPAPAINQEVPALF